MIFLQPKPTTTNSARSRIPLVIAIVCFAAMVGCGDPTGPRTICCTPKPEQSVNALAVLAPELHDAADVFAQGVADASLRNQTESAINRLAEQLLAGKVAPSRTALAQARSLLAGLSDISAIELAQVALALDYVERRMNEILNAVA
jgi:hypothetical protein